MFRTVYVSAGEGITVVDNWLLIKNKQGEESKIPVDDIYTLLLENVHTRISVYALQYLSRRGVNVVCCDDKYLPACNVIPFVEHYRPYGVMKKQLALVNLLNVEVNWNNKIMKLHNAIDKYIASFTTAIDKADVNKLLIPKLRKNG